MPKKLGLVLGSGGARGFAHIGFLKALEENGVKPDVVTGCSIGAIVGAVYLTGKPVDEMKNIAFSLTKGDIIDINLNLFRSMAMLRSAKVDKILSDLLGTRKIKDLPVPFAAIATDLVSGKLVTFTDGDLFTAVRASMAIPAVFAPVKRGKKILVDGGVLSRTPVAAAKELGAEVTVAVDLLGKAPDYSEIKNILQLAIRAIDVGDHRENKLRRRDTPDLMLEPDLKGMSPYKIAEREFAYDEGYKLGVMNVDNIKELLKG